jgi:hypothetical protein
MNKKTVTKIEKVIDHHSFLRDRHFFNVPAKTEDREKFENTNTKHTNFIYGGDKYRVKQIVFCIDKAVKYRLEVYKNGELLDVDIRFFKRLLRDRMKRN